MFDHLVQSKVYTSNTSFTTTSPSPGQCCTDSTFKTMLASICLNFTIDHIRDSIPRPWSIWPRPVWLFNFSWFFFHAMKSSAPVNTIGFNPPRWGKWQKNFSPPVFKHTWLTTFRIYLYPSSGHSLTWTGQLEGPYDGIPVTNWSGCIWSQYPICPTWTSQTSKLTVK